MKFVQRSSCFSHSPVSRISLTGSAGVKSFLYLVLNFSIFFMNLCIFFFSIRHTPARAREHPFSGPIFCRRRSLLCVHPTRSAPSLHPLGCCPPNISSILMDHDELSELPGYPGRAGRLINRPMTVRTISDFKHPRTGCTTLVLVSATTELFVVNLIPQHDPQSDPQLAGYRHARSPQTFLNQFAAIETLQLRIFAYRMSTGFTPKKPQQRTALFRDSTEPPVSSTGVLPRDDPHVTGQRLTIHEPPGVAQEYLGRQCRDRPYSRMRHEPSCSGTLVRLLGDLLRQVFDFLFHLPVQSLQRASPIGGMGLQRQECNLGLPVVTPQSRPSA